MYNAGFRQNVIFLEQCNSTNLYAGNFLNTHPECHGTVIRTNFQSAGKGQHSNTWMSKKGENILASFILQPDFLDITKNFYISMIASLAITNVVKKHCKDVMIKWPNDIYCKRKKLAGILIENSLMGAKVKHSVVGMGININQIDFPKELPNPISLKLITGKEVSIENVFSDILKSFDRYYEALNHMELPEIKNAYMDQLIGIDEELLYKDENEVFEGVVIDIEDDGMLIIQDKKNNLRKYYFKEVKML